MKARFSQKGLLLIFFMSAFTSVALANYIISQTTASSSGQLIVTGDIVNQNPKLPSTGYMVELFRYSDMGGPVSVIATVTQKAGSVFNLYDQSIAEFKHVNPDIHYSILVMQHLANGSLIRLLNYHWSSELQGNNVVNPIALNLIVLADGNVKLVVNGKVVPHIINISGTNTGKEPNNSNQTSLNSIGGNGQEIVSDEWPIYIFNGNHTVGTNGQQDAAYTLSSYNPISVPSPYPNVAYAQPNSCFPVIGGEGVYCWVKVASWSNLPTTIGEATGSGYMTDIFSYGQSSGSQLDVVESANGGGWSVSGSWTLYNTQSEATTWPPLHCCTNYYAETYFNYEEDQLEYSYIFCWTYDDYQIWATGWDGGDVGWIDAGPSSSPPGDCLPPSTVEQDYSYGQYAAGSGFTEDTANGYRYSVAVTISAGIVGTSASAQIGDTTAYNHHTSQSITFGYQYPYYYLYTNGKYSDVSQWPVLFSTNTQAYCGP
jgi:hypothetical protein